MNDILVKLESERRDVYIMGDFNIDLLNYNTHCKTTDFLDLMFSFNMYPLISKPTRITSYKASLIDNIFTNTIHKSKYSGLIYSDLSDHFPIYCLCKDKENCFVPTHNKNYKKRLVDDRGIFMFKEKLGTTDWHTIYDNNDVNVCYDYFIDKFRTLYDECFPVCTSTSRKFSHKVQFKKPWITNGILRSIKRKHRMYKVAVHTLNTRKKIIYNDYKNRLTSIIRASKAEYYSRLFYSVKGDMVKTWREINNLLGKNKHSSLPLKMFDENLSFHSSKDKAQAFNSLFINMAKKLSASIPNSSKSFNDFLTAPCMSSLFLNPTSSHEIISLCHELKMSKATGPDDVLTSVLKKCIHFFVDPLCNIYNKSLVSGIFPNKLKVAKVIPLYKKGPVGNIENYRPIALLSTFSKLLEKIMFKRLYTFLLKNNSLASEQFGFRKNHSTSLSILNITNYIASAFDEGKFCCGVFMDLSKAFDTIDHHILLKKLHYYGIRGVPLEWFRSYLLERKQYVMADGTESDCLCIDTGVPQGSVLGPLLFLLYINDILNSSSILKFSLFADDTAVISSHKDINLLISNINYELRKISEWYICNKLFLNAEKTHYVIFHSKQKRIPSHVAPVRIKDDVLKKTDIVEFLGIKLHESLDWCHHITHICSKISRGVGIMSFFKKTLPKHILLTIYNSIVLPHINYCNIIWGNTYKTHLYKIHILQKRAVRIISNSNYLTSSAPLFYDLKCLPVFDLIKLNNLVFMFKFHKQELPSIFNNMFKTNSFYHSYETRNKSNYHYPFVRTSLTQHTLRFQGIHDWNSLPYNLKSSSTLSKFKYSCKQFLFKSNEVH